MKELICKTENTHQYTIIIEKGIKARLSQMKALFSQYHKLVFWLLERDWQYVKNVLF